MGEYPSPIYLNYKRRLNKMEEEIKIDANALEEQEIVILDEPSAQQGKSKKKAVKQMPSAEPKELVNCLRNEIVTVRYIRNEKTGITDPKHPAHGGLMDNGEIILTVPQLRNGLLKDPLTKEEKAFFEDYFNMEYNALSIYNKPEENYWTNFQVILHKSDTILKLSDATDYIKYKVLLANSNAVANSLKALRENPKATYQFVLVSTSEVYSDTVEKTNLKEACWEKYLEVKDKADVLRVIIEGVEGKTTSADTKIEFLRSKCGELIESRPKDFLNAVSDRFFDMKIMIKKATDKGVIMRRGEEYYYNNTPLCDKDEYPTLTAAAAFLSRAKNQEMKFAIEAKLK